MLVDQRIKTLYIGKSWCRPNVGPILFSQRHKTVFTSKKKNCVGPTLAWCCSTDQMQTNSAILYVGPMLALRCKANTIKDVPFQIHLAHFDVGPMLALRCVPNANYQPTVQRFSNVGPTLAQRSHAIWARGSSKSFPLCSLAGYIREVRDFSCLISFQNRRKSHSDASSMSLKTSDIYKSCSMLSSFRKFLIARL